MQEQTKVLPSRLTEKLLHGEMQQKKLQMMEYKAVNIIKNKNKKFLSLNYNQVFCGNKKIC